MSRHGIADWSAKNLRAAIAGHVGRHPGITWPQLDAYFGKGNVSRPIFQAALDALLAAGAVVEGPPRCYRVPKDVPRPAVEPTPPAETLELWGPV